MIAEKMPTDCDFCEIVLIDAANRLGGVPLCELVVYATADVRIEARKIQGQYGFELVLVPKQFVVGDQYSWAVSHPRGIVWSPGA